MSDIVRDIDVFFAKRIMIQVQNHQLKNHQIIIQMDHTALENGVVNVNKMLLLLKEN